MPDFVPPPLFVWGLFVLIAVGALLPVRLDRREDHVIPTIVAAVAVALLGPPALIIILGGFVVAVLALLIWSRIPRHGEPMNPDGTRRSIMWMGVTALSVTVGFIVANLLYSTVLGRTYPYTLATSADAFVGGVVGSVAWIGAMSVRIISQRWATGSVMTSKFDPFDSMLMPYLVPTVCGASIITAAIAIYNPTDPWASLSSLLWCFPLYGVTRLEVHRRTLGQELRRETLAKQRLAAIGEVSARIVHQSRHEVGLMGWSIYRLRAQIDQGGLGGEAAIAAVRQELDALTEAKDRLGEMLASELLHEGKVDRPDDTGEAAGSSDGGERVTVTLTELVDGVVSQFGAKADHAGIVLEVQVRDGAGLLPAAPQLRDVVFNLVDNAIDAARSSVTIEIVLGDPGREVVRVGDDGPGLSEHEEDRVFEPFFTTKSDGTGMGLAIADALVGDLGGDLRYERAGDVTTFAVTLPVAVRDPQGTRS